MMETVQARVSFRERLKAHLAIARLDHSIKNLFVLPGIVVPLSVDPALRTWRLLPTLLLAFVAITLVACSNYVINEVLDAPFDRLHPTKRNRPAARGLVNIPLAYVQWIAMMLAGVGLGLRISKAICDYRACALADGVRVQHPAAADKGCAVPGRADGEREQSAADAAGLVRGGGVHGAAAEPADVLLDDWLLLYGAEAVQRTARDWRSRRGGIVPRELQALHAGVAAGERGVLCVDGDAVLWGVCDPVPH